MSPRALVCKYLPVARDEIFQFGRVAHDLQKSTTNCTRHSEPMPTTGPEETFAPQAEKSLENLFDDDDVDGDAEMMLIDNDDHTNAAPV